MALNAGAFPPHPHPQLIVAPVAAGMMLSALLPRLISKLKPLLSLLALVRPAR